MGELNKHTWDFTQSGSNETEEQFELSSVSWDKCKQFKLEHTCASGATEKHMLLVNNKKYKQK